MSRCDQRHSLISVSGHHAARFSVFSITTETTQARDGCPRATHRRRPAAPWVTAERSPAPTQRLILSPRHRSTASSFRARYGFRRRPSRLTLGVAAATVAAAAGVAAGLSAGAPAPGGAASSLAELSHAAAQADALRVGAGSTPALSWQAALGTFPAHSQAVPPVVESTQPSGRKTAGR